MELIKRATHRNLLSEILYVSLNVGLAVAILALVNAFQPPYLAAVLFLLSKWRIFAARPRFWFAHLQSNVVDIVVGLSFVGLLYSAELPLQIALTVFFIGWLLLLKPKSRRRNIVAQAGVAQFVGLTALALVSHVLPSSLFVIGAALIGYGACRHVMVAYKEDNASLVALCYGLITAELAWIYYHWMVTYQTLLSVAVPQLAIIMLLISFSGYQLYAVYHKSGRIHMREARLPVMVLTGTLIIVFAFFTKWSFVL